MEQRIRATLVRASVKWLDGGAEDECMVLTPYPCKLGEVADAIDAHPGGCDEPLGQLAEQIRKIGREHVVANSSTRFVAILGDELAAGYPDGKCVVELQELCLCATAGLAVDTDYDGDQLVNLKHPAAR